MLELASLLPPLLTNMLCSDEGSWTRNPERERERNHPTETSLTILADGYTFYAVSQERFLDKLEEEAKVARARYPQILSPNK
uniref:Cytochrome c oxidase assembly factor 3 mitochondrial coiled-coil domain-containing protein n=1 Tax=Callorhinchus milii TaxID=7868 RepID=A0A4W3HBD7_CALMI